MSKIEKAKIEKAGTGVPSPPITLVAMKIFQNFKVKFMLVLDIYFFYPTFDYLNWSKFLKRGMGEILTDYHDYQLIEF